MESNIASHAYVSAHIPSQPHCDSEPQISQATTHADNTLEVATLLPRRAVKQADSHDVSLFISLSGKKHLREALR